MTAADLTKPLAELEARITQYLEVGGFWNPEHMEHDKVRQLLIDIRTTSAVVRAQLDEAIRAHERLAVAAAQADMKALLDGIGTIYLGLGVAKLGSTFALEEIKKLVNAATIQYMNSDRNALDAHDAEVRNLALEEAAQMADSKYKLDLGDAIRALKTGGSK